MNATTTDSLASMLGYFLTNGDPLSSLKVISAAAHSALVASGHSTSGRIEAVTASWVRVIEQLSGAEMDAAEDAAHIITCVMVDARQMCFPGLVKVHT